MLVLGFGLALLAVPAYSGVKWGQRREDEAVVRDAGRSEGKSISVQGRGTVAFGDEEYQGPATRFCNTL